MPLRGCADIRHPHSNYKTLYAEPCGKDLQKRLRTTGQFRPVVLIHIIQMYLCGVAVRTMICMKSNQIYWNSPRTPSEVQSARFTGWGLPDSLSSLPPQIYCLFKIISAAITPGTQPQRVRRKVISTEPHPLSITARGGNRIAKSTLQNDISPVCFNVGKRRCIPFPFPTSIFLFYHI